MTTLRTFLKAAPQPSTLVGIDDEGDRKTVKVSDQRSRWRDAEQSLAGCVKVDAIDKDGAILRTWVDPEFEGEVAGPTVRRPANTELVELGRLLNQAADQAVERNAQTVQQALDANNALVKVLSERNQQLERAWHRLLMQQEPAVEGAAPGDLNMQMVTQLLAIALGGGAALPPAQKNGKPDEPR